LTPELYEDYYLNGQLRVRGYLKNVNREGLWREWHMNGQLEREGYYKDGNLNGLWRWWYKNGQLECEGYYKNDKRDGLWQEWYENGQLKVRGHYKNGNRDGIWRGWYEDGQLEYEGMCRNDKWNGFWRMWHKNGQLLGRGTQKDDRFDGLWHWYDKNGKLKFQTWYLYGVEVSESEYKMSPEEVDIRKYILDEPNVERRRAWIKKVGLERIYQKLNPKVLDKTDDGQYDLLAFDNIYPDIIMKVLKMRDPSLGVYYFINVHPDCKTVAEALRFYYKGKKLQFIKEV